MLESKNVFLCFKNGGHMLQGHKRDFHKANMGHLENQIKCNNEL